jgi:hypothetical protein
MVSRSVSHASAVQARLRWQRQPARRAWVPGKRNAGCRCHRKRACTAEAWLTDLDTINRDRGGGFTEHTPAAGRVTVEKVAYRCNKHTCAYPTHAELIRKALGVSRRTCKIVILIRNNLLDSLSSLPVPF